MGESPPSPRSDLLIVVRNLGEDAIASLDRISASHGSGARIIVDAGSTDTTYDAALEWIGGGAGRSLFWVDPSSPEGPAIGDVAPSVDSAYSVSGSAVVEHSLSSITEQVGRGLRPARAARPLSFDDVEQRRAFGGVVLCPGARYHIDELGPLADALRRRGRRSTIMLPPSQFEPIVTELTRYDVPAFRWPADIRSVPAFDAIVTLNDWGPARKLVELAAERNVPSFSKVEGVQDFEDVDTGRERHAYRRTDYVLGQGSNDVASLPGCKVSVVGNSRLERVASVGHVPDAPRGVVINSNFTYGVLTDERERWLSSVLEACELNGVVPSISQHHADGALPAGMQPSPYPIRHLLAGADVLVSRFSTVPFEAIARGAAFIYHNPHGERVPTFVHAGGAFPATADVASLAEAIREALESRPATPDAARRFFADQIDIGVSSSEERSADRVEEVLTRWQ